MGHAIELRRTNGLAMFKDGVFEFKDALRPDRLSEVDE